MLTWDECIALSCPICAHTGADKACLASMFTVAAALKDQGAAETEETEVIGWLPV